MSHKKAFGLDVGLPWLLPILIVSVWQVIASFNLISADYLRNISAPNKIVVTFWQLLLSGEMLNNILVSTQRALIGFALGAGFGLVFGFLTGVSRYSRLIFNNTLFMLNNIPHLALMPLVILWFGVGEEAKVFLVALGTFFPMYLNTYNGIKTIDQGLLEMAISYGLTKWQLLKDIILPGALPSVLVGLRYSLGYMWLTLIVAETIAADAGIGYMAMLAREFMQADVIILCILLYAFLGVAADFIARKLEQHFLSWNRVYQ